MRQGLRERPTRRHQAGRSGQSDTRNSNPAGQDASATADPDRDAFVEPDAAATADSDRDAFVEPDAAATADANSRAFSFTYAYQDVGTSGNTYPTGTRTRDGPRSLRDLPVPVRDPQRNGKPRTISVIPAAFDPDTKTYGAKTELTVDDEKDPPTGGSFSVPRLFFCDTD